MFRLIYPTSWLLMGILFALSTACSSTLVSKPSKITTQTAEMTRWIPGEVSPIKGPKSVNGYQIILGTPDLGVGSNRMGFVLTSPQGFVKENSVDLVLLHMSGDLTRSEIKQTVIAEYHPWPYGSRGLYVTELDFDTAGIWRMDVMLEIEDGAVETIHVVFDVRHDPFAPEVGDKAPFTETKTVSDVARLSQLTTGSLQDPDLYGISLAEAVKNGLPTIVVFASPAFCINEVCGPQIEVLQQLKDKYLGQANFVHVDFYDNPDEIQGNLANAVISPAVVEWHLPSIEWTFVIDHEGIITGRFEAFTRLEEIEEALLRLL